MAWYECIGGSGGGGTQDHDYSTTEQKIGTWIDGSDVYEQTFNFTPTSASYTINLTSLNISKIISFIGSVEQTSGNIVPLQYGTSYNDYAFAYYDKNSKNLKVAYAGTYNTAEWNVIIQYTKT